MDLIAQIDIVCPHCGETFPLQIDTSESEQSLIETEELEKIGQQPMPVRDFAGQPSPGGGENETAIFLVFEQSLGIEALHHISHAGLGNLKRGGDINDAGVTFGINEFQDAFEV